MPWAPNYLGLTEARDFVGLDDDRDDAHLITALAMTAKAINRYCNRQFGRTDEATEFFYTARYDYDTRTWRVDIDDLFASDDLVVKVNDTTISSAGYRLRPRDAAAKGEPYTLLVFTSSAETWPCGAEDEVAITADPWGWLAIPDAIKHANKLELNRVHWRRESPAGVAGSPQLGSEIRLLSKLDPDTIKGLKDYVRTRGPR